MQAPFQPDVLQLAPPCMITRAHAVCSVVVLSTQGFGQLHDSDPSAVDEQLHFVYRLSSAGD